MRFSIATTTTTRIINDLIEAQAIKRTPLHEVTGYVNFSARVINDEYVVELNDEVIIKYLGLIVKLSKLIDSAMRLMDTDIEDLAKFITAKKGN